MDLSLLELSVRAKNALMSSGIRDFGSLMQAYNSGVNFKNIRNLGAKTLDEIRSYCEQYVQNEHTIFDEISALELSPEFKKKLIDYGYKNVTQLKDFNIENFIGLNNKVTDVDKVIMNSIVYTLSCSSLNTNNKRIPKGFDADSEISENTAHRESNLVYDKVSDLFLREIRIFRRDRFIEVQRLISEFRFQVLTGHISDIEYVYNVLKIYVELKFDLEYGSLIGVLDLKKIKSNNQMIYFFITKKLAPIINNLNVTKDGIHVLLTSLVSNNERWLLNRLIGIFGYRYIEILNQFYVVNSAVIGDYLDDLRSVESLSRSRAETVKLSPSVVIDKEFLNILVSVFPIQIDDKGIVSNIVGETPVVEKIFIILNELSRPLSFDDFWKMERIAKSSQSGIRTKVNRDKRFIVYGKLGYVGLSQWDLTIDDVISGNIADNVILLIKRYDLTRISYASFSKLYSRLRKRISLESWKSNLQLSSDSISISSNYAILVGHHYSVDNQLEFLSSILDRIENIYKGIQVNPKEIMDLAFEIALVDHGNFSTTCKTQVDDVLSLIRGNVDLLKSKLTLVLDKIDVHFVEVCLSLKLSILESHELILKKFQDIISDGSISYGEREELTKFISEKKLSIDQVRQRISESILNEVILIDKQISYIFQYRGVNKLSYTDLLGDLGYLLFNYSGISNCVWQSKVLIIEDGFCLYSGNTDHVSSIELEIFGREIKVNIKKSLWDNVIFDFDEVSNKPCLNVYSSNLDEVRFLLEDGIISFLIIENAIEPLNIVKARFRIREKLKRIDQGFLE